MRRTKTARKESRASQAEMNVRTISDHVAERVHTVPWSLENDTGDASAKTFSPRMALIISGLSFVSK